ncbi:MAG: hypothetical protein K2L21_07690 [Muribaculaceae bacterium]|nr:hypothetical protein [Muribaculaceae bacterium]
MKTWLRHNFQEHEAEFEELAVIALSVPLDDYYVYPGSAQWGAPILWLAGLFRTRIIDRIWYVAESWSRRESAPLHSPRGMIPRNEL